MEKFSMEWSKFHEHNDGTTGRDTTVRNGLGKAVGRVESDDYKTEVEDIQLSEGTYRIEKLKSGKVIGGGFSSGMGSSGGGSGSGY